LSEILGHSIEIFGRLDKTFQSPRSYVSFIHLFVKIVNMKKNLITEQKQRIQVCILLWKSRVLVIISFQQIGVTKLSEARSQVNQLQLEASEQEKLLEQKQLEAKSALQKITDTIKSAGVKRGEMQDLRETIAQENRALVER
jgi:dynein heavy chain 2, cytosolic